MPPNPAHSLTPPITEPDSSSSGPVTPRPAPPARFVLNPDALDQIYPTPVRDLIADQVDLRGEPLTAAQVKDDPKLLSGVRALFSGWGAPRLTPELLEAAADLEIIFYGAGATKGFYTEEAKARGIQVAGCNAINATPVVEYTLAQIVMCLKRIWQQAFELRTHRRFEQSAPGASGYGSTVGVLSLGDIGLRVVEGLAAMDVRVVVYDIQRDPELAARHGFEYIELDALFAASDVLTIHTPLNPHTRGLVTGPLLASMKPGASLLNTARGGVVDQPALVEVFRQRDDLFAVLDVTDPEPPATDDPIWTLPNVVLTPHIAGSLGRECERMGRTMLEEVTRYRAGEPLQWRVH